MNPESVLVNMSFIIIALGLFTVSTAQHHHHAAILSDTRYLAGDGTFGAAYKQEDGVEFKEESDANGDRRGSYSYVDPNGVRRTVTYTAGKNGFQVRDELKASGDGIPKPPPQIPPQPEYEPLPQYNPPDYRPPGQAYPQYQPQHPVYQPRPTPPPPPPPVFHQKYQPRYESQYQQPEFAHQPHYQYPQYQAPSRPEPQFKPEAFRYSFTSPLKSTARPQYNEFTTPSPRRFYPPGKLDFTRTPDGFTYSFTKN